MLRTYVDTARSVAVAAVSAVMSLLMMIAPAGAQTTSATAQIPPPPCVNVFVDRFLTTETAHVVNGCGVEVRVKVFVAFGPDSACEIVYPGQEFSHSWVSPPGRFDGAQLC